MLFISYNFYPFLVTYFIVVNFIVFFDFYIPLPLIYDLLKLIHTTALLM